MAKRKLTPKQLVLKRNPGAWLWYRDMADDYVVMPRRGHNLNQALGLGHTPQQAWAAADKPRISPGERR